jgi:hypothetical protein
MRLTIRPAGHSVAAGACVFLPKPYTPQQVQMMLLMLASKAG